MVKRNNVEIVTEGVVELAEDEAVQILKDYGVGIDCHSKFIQVCVYYHDVNSVRKIERTFPVSWRDLLSARDWVKEMLRTKPIPPVEIEPFHYTIESTGTYHLPILRAFGGHPSVVNPLLASPSRRKTDVLDSRLLAYQNMTGLWPESFVASNDIQELRVVIRQRDTYLKVSSAITNRINNFILRFGHTIGSLGSVKDKTNRAIIEDMCSDDFVPDEKASVYSSLYICPDGLPDTAKKVILKMYDDHDYNKKKSEEMTKLAISMAKGMEWECHGGVTVSGEILFKNLCSTPGIGEQSALVWLSEIITPLRFPNQKALVAYTGCDPSVKVSAGKVTSQTRRGGNKKLHEVLLRSAGLLVNHHSEPFGRWGYNIKCKSSKGGYKKACAAVARRLCVALFNVHMYIQEFSYAKYRFWQADVKDIGLTEMSLSERVIKLMKTYGYLSSKKIANDYMSGRLASLAGVGAKTLQEISMWVENNKGDVEHGRTDDKRT